MAETTTPTLADFLLARIAEDEATARAAEPGPWIGWRGWFEEGQGKRPDRPDGHAVLARDGRMYVVHEWDSDEGSVPHIARWDPARVLVECETKRRRVTFLAETAAKCPEDDWPEDGDMALAPLSDMARYLLQMEALPHSDHPDYREEWRP